MSRGLLDRFIAEKIATTKHKRQRKAEQKPRLLPKQLAYANTNLAANHLLPKGGIKSVAQKHAP